MYKARAVSNGETAAVKIMEAVVDKEEDIKSELNVFNNHSRHPNIVNFIGAFLKKDQAVDDQLWIVMEVYYYKLSRIYTYRLKFAFLIVLCSGICNRSGQIYERAGREPRRRCHLLRSSRSFSRSMLSSLFLYHPQRYQRAECSPDIQCTSQTHRLW